METKFIDIEGNNIKMGDKVEVYSMNHRIGFGKVVEVDDVPCVEHIGEYTEYMIMNLDYLTSIKAIKIIS